MGESTHEHATDNLTLYSPFASKMQIKPKFNLSGILPWLNNNLSVGSALLRKNKVKESPVRNLPEPGDDGAPG